MTGALATIHQAEDATAWLTRSLPSLRHDQGARDRAAMLVAELTKPAPAEWAMARVAAMLSPYYDRDTPHAVRLMEAEDWAEALAPFPQWAIDRAVRWWKSADNADRRKRPLEGDIVARCRIEMDPVRAAQAYLRQPMVAPVSHALPRPPVPEAQERRQIADRIMAEVFRGKRVSQ